MTTLAIIPARAGSKRLPGKNMRELGGSPLLHYSLMQARYSNLINHILVTSDSKEVKDYCKKLQFPVFLDRPNELCTDTARSEDVVLFCIQHSGLHCKKVILLQPTSPLRGIDDINNCIELSKYGSVVSVTPFCHPLTYKKNGAIYVWDTHRIVDGNFEYDICYVMPPERSVDIDTEEDFMEAERRIRERNRV